MVQEDFLERVFLQGTQSYLDFLPEKHTDFIFTLFSEEFGFIGSVGLLLFMQLLFIEFQIGAISRSILQDYFVMVLLLLFFYITVNMIYGFRITTNSWFSTSNNVLWRIFNVSNNDWFWYCNECQSSQSTTIA